MSSPPQCCLLLCVTFKSVSSQEDNQHLMSIAIDSFCSVLEFSTNGIMLFVPLLSFTQHNEVHSCSVRRRQWQPTPVFLPGESQGWGSLVGCRLMGSHRVGHGWSDLVAAAACSVQFCRSVVSDSLWPYESQHARPPCPSPTPGVLSNSHPSSRWCHPAISSSVIPSSSCPKSLPASESFPMNQLFAWGGQSTGVAALASFFKRNPRADLLQNGLVGSPCSPRDSQESSPPPQFKSINSSALSLLHSPTLTSIHDHRKNHSLD